MQLSLSVEDTNKIRERSGSRLIPVSGFAAQSDERKSRALAVLAAREAHYEDKNESKQDKPHNQTELSSDAVSLRIPHGSESKDNSADSTLSTIAWLQKIRAQAVETSDSPEHQKDATPSSDTLEQGTNSANKHSAEEGRAAGVTSGSNEMHSIVHKDNTLLQEPTSKSPEPFKTSISIDNKPKKAIFKPKKIKKHAAPRNSLNRQRASSNIEKLARDEQAKFEELLNLSRIRHSRKLQISDEEALKKSENYQAPHSKVLISQIVEKTTNSAKSDEDSPSQLPDKDRIDTENPDVKMVQHEIEPLHSSDNMAKNDEMEDKEELYTNTGGLGLAETLKKLRSNRSDSSESSKSLSKDWSKKIILSQKSREVELKELTKKYASLPPKERDEALKIHKQQLSLEQAAEAQELERNYRPIVDLDYKDEAGKTVSPRHAFKELSRAFHGSK